MSTSNFNINSNQNTNLVSQATAMTIHHSHTSANLSRRNIIPILFSALSSIAKEFIYGLSCFIIESICKIFKTNIYLDENKLIINQKKMSFSEQQWFINLALMKEISQIPEISIDQKKQVEFLALNYLQKTAPIHVKLFRTFFKDLDSRFQVAPPHDTEDWYHRFSLKKNFTVGARFSEQLALSKSSPLVLTETVEFEQLFPLKFDVMQEVPADGVFQELVERFSSSNAENLMQKPLDTPFLFDLTSTLGKNIKTSGEKKKELVFKNDLKAFKDQLSNAITKTVNEIISRRPDLASKKSQIEKFIKRNITCICRAELENISGVKILPLFCEINTSNIENVHKDFMEFLISTGVVMGSINLRREITNIFDDHKNMRFAVQSKRVPPHSLMSRPCYPNLTDFTESALYQRLAYLFASEISKSKKQSTNLGISLENLNERKDQLQAKPHITLLGKATMDLLSGLFSKINDGRWQELHNDPVLLQLTQTTLFKIHNFLATAELHLLDYNKFSLQMELVNAELMNLLEIIQPYKEGDFEGIIKNSLQSMVPEKVKPYFQAGLGKTAVNVCSAIKQAAMQIVPSPQSVYSKGFYFEQAGLIGDGNKFEIILNDIRSPKVDLYFGQFNPNIEIDANFKNYERRDIIKDIHALIDNGRAAEKLTVAIDTTIDAYYSDNIRGLLNEFEKEIAEGKLNFVFFASGVKFSMLGMDNCFGAPMFIVNNGAAYWQAFNSIPTKKAHQADILSHQWFCLSNEFSSDSLALYRKLIFDNTRRILDSVPERLKNNNLKIRINTANADVNACFIDIKVLKPGHKLKSYELYAKFYNKMLSKGVKVQTRSTFGLSHPNALIIRINEIKDSASIRLHPGLDPEEASAFYEFFQEI